MSTVAFAYVPVLHKGYLDFFRHVQTAGATKLFLVGDDILMAYAELDYINRKDRLRALPERELIKSIQSVTTLQVSILTREKVKMLNVSHIITPKEDISRLVVEQLFPAIETTYVDVFLRWNTENIGEENIPTHSAVVSSDLFMQTIWKDILVEGAKSADWWRQVGAALVKDGEVLYVTHNEHMPEEQQPNIDGDTRSLFKKGININYVTAAHAEVVAIGEAARRGISTEGSELYVTDFPCPYCSRLIAKAGIKKVYFMKGYAVLEGDEFLKGEGIELVHIEL